MLDLIFTCIRANFIVLDDTEYCKYALFQNTILSKVAQLSSTYHRQNQAFKNIPKPKEVFLGQRIERKYSKQINAFIDIPASDKFMYISLIENMKYLCQNTNFQKNIFKINSTRNDCLLTDISDGNFMKNNILHNQKDVTLQIQLYTDDFEPVNGMGYKTGIHKITAFYYIIRNLPSYLNSELKNIHLLGLAYAQDIKKYGFNVVLRQFVNEMELLESKLIEIDFLYDQIYLRGSLVAVSADNLGANSLLGFVESL